MNFMHDMHVCVASSSSALFTEYDLTFDTLDSSLISINCDLMFCDMCIGLRSRNFHFDLRQFFGMFRQLQ